MTGSQTTTWNTSGVAPQVDQAQGTVTVFEGIASDVIFDFGSCKVPFDVRGELAVLQPGYVCNFTIDGVNATASYQSGSATRSGSVATYSASGNLSMVYQGKTFTAITTQALTLTKMAR